MFARQLSRVKLTGCQKTTGMRFLSVSNPSGTENEEEAAPPKRLKQWRGHLDPGTQKLSTKLKIFDRSEGRPPMDFIARMNAPWDVSINGLRKWVYRRQRIVDIEDQKFREDRHAILGSNLAAAHFLVLRGAKVKFSGRSEWVTKNKDDEYDLPDKYVPDYVVEAIDAGGMTLYYEGLDNMRNLYDLRLLSFKGSKTVDDWFLDRISSRYPRLEHLDVSDCEKVSERGLEALYRMQSLRVLVVTNHHNSVAFELTCMMLEDCNPDLKCVIKPGETKKAAKAESLT